LVGQEANKSHPDYQEALEEWDSNVKEASTLFIVRNGVEAEVDQVAVTAMREMMRREGIELDPDDHFVYVMNCLISNQVELIALCDAIQGRSQPTEAGVANAIEQFRPDVQG
jgi:hypothetical protein